MGFRRERQPNGLRFTGGDPKPGFMRSSTHVLSLRVSLGDRSHFRRKPSSKDGALDPVFWSHHVNGEIPQRGKGCLEKLVLSDTILITAGQNIVDLLHEYHSLSLKSPSANSGHRLSQSGRGTLNAKSCPPSPLLGEAGLGDEGDSCKRSSVPEQHHQEQ